MTDRTVVSISLSADELAIIDAEHERMSRTLVGMSVTRSDAIKNMMLRSDRHLARLWDVPSDVLATDMAEALRALGEDDEVISQTLTRFFRLHERSRELHLPAAEASDI